MKRLVLILIGVVAVVGVVDALANLPVVSGCAFYDECEPAAAQTPA